MVIFSRTRLFTFWRFLNTSASRHPEPRNGRNSTDLYRASYEQDGWVGEFYVYENEEEKRGKLGGRLGYQTDHFQLEVDYIESLYENQAASIHGHINMNSLMFIAEYVVIEHKESAQNEPKQSETKQLEVAYALGAMTISAAYQESSALDDFELPKEKASLTVGGEINSTVSLGAEVGRTDGQEDLMLLLTVML